MIALDYRLGSVLLLCAISGCVGGGSSPTDSGSGTTIPGQSATGSGATGTAGTAATAGGIRSGGTAGGSTSAGNSAVSGGGTGGKTGGATPATGAGGTGASAAGTGAGGTIGGMAAAMSFPAGDKTSHFPLVDGASWTYHHTKPMTAAWDEVDTAQATTYMGKPAFIFEDQEDAMGVQTHSTLTLDGTGVFRAYKELTIMSQKVLTVTYSPAFLRYDEAWTQMGQKVSLVDKWTQNCLLGGTAASKCTAGTTTPGMTTHDFTVLATSVKVTVPAGTFDTIQVQRTDPAKPETKIFWFAAGVGKVREEVPATMSVTELSSYKIP